MAILFNSLFDRLGRIGKILHLTHTHQAALPAAYEAILDSYPDEHATVANLSLLVPALIAAPADILPSVAETAERTLLEMVKADVPSVSTLGDALAELYRQMVVSSQSVQSATVSQSSTAIGTNIGDGNLAVSIRRGDGRINELIYPEVLRIQCTGDSYIRRLRVGAEQFLASGRDSVSRWQYNSQTGSGARRAIVAADAASDGGANLITNGNFRDWAANDTLPRDWELPAGILNTTFLRSSSPAPYSGGFCVKLVPAATLTTFQKRLTGALRPLENYAVSFRCKRIGTATAGKLVVRLTDASGTVLADDSANDNEHEITASAIGTDWTLYTFEFRTPTTLPSEVLLRFAVTTALEGADILVDHVALSQMQPLYTSGPKIAIFAGAVPFRVNDGWNLTLSNNLGGSSNGATFQILFDRLFQTRVRGLQLPTSGSPTQADTKITG